VYQIENSREVLDRGFSLPKVSRNVLLIGLVSFFTDISSEMVVTILPLFLIYSVGLSPFAFGVVDGIYQGGTAVARLAGGFVADRTRRHKEVAAAGYAISAVSRLALLATGTWAAIATVIAVDRAGKGLRTAPRDALISLSSRPEQLGQSFGVHRALDTAGAMLGPLVAFALLALMVDPFEAVFVLSFLFGVIGLAILLLFVRNRPVAVPGAPRLTLRKAAAILKVRPFRSLVGVGTLLGLVTVSDGFMYLALEQRDVIPISAFPLLYVGTALVYMVLAVPVGRLADSIGRRRVFLAGYVLLLGAYGFLLVDLPGALTVPLVLLLFGAYYAATDGVLPALASTTIVPAARATGLAVLATGTGVARLVASLVVGAVWTWAGLETTLALFAGMLAVALVLAALVLRRSLRPVAA
jgi:MFS family permease